MREVETVQPLASPPTFGRTINGTRCTTAEAKHFFPRRPIRARQAANVTVDCNLLALCNMRTLYLRNVPNEVVERLERLARMENTSVSALAVRELAVASRRVDNPDLLADLPDLNIDAGTLVGGIDTERATR